MRAFKSLTERLLAPSIATTLGSIGGVLLCLLACRGYESADPTEVCKEAGYSIANRTLACTGDNELANTRYRRTMSEFQCLAQPSPPPVDPGQPDPPGKTFQSQLQCAQSLFELTCDQVIASGDNLATWLSISEGCSTLFSNSGPDGGIDGAVFVDAADGSNPCVEGSAICEEGGTCTSLVTDPQNCGACGHACLSNQACVGSVCN